MPRTLVIIRTEESDDIVLTADELSNDTKICLMRDVKQVIDNLEEGTEKLKKLLEEV